MRCQEGDQADCVHPKVHRVQTLHDMRLMEEGWARCSRVKFVQVRRKIFHVPETLQIESATVYELLVMPGRSGWT